MAPTENSDRRLTKGEHLNGHHSGRVATMNQPADLLDRVGRDDSFTAPFTGLGRDLLYHHMPISEIKNLIDEFVAETGMAANCALHDD
jgi:hypothetical protein